MIRRNVIYLIALTSLVGCAGYKIGTRTLYRNDVRTIHVPIIKSDSFRPELGVMLTASVQKEIERRTPFKLTNIETADSVMTCKLTSDSKRVVSETNLDDPRLIQSVMTVEVSWTNRQGMPLIETRFLPPGESTFYFAENVDFVPEAGQSISTANQRVVERLADHIVDQMEARW